MPVPSSITDLSQTAGSNSPAGTESPITADDYLRAYAAFIAMLRDGKGFSDPATLASAATTDIGAQASMFVKITGTTTITSFGTNYEGPRFIRFVGALTLTHNASTLTLPGGANITTEANDSCIAIPNATPNGWDVVHYQRNDLAPGVADSLAAGFVSALTTVVLDSATDYVVIGDTSDSGNSKKALLTAATATASGIVELATTAEAAASSDTTRAVTAAGVKAAIDAYGPTLATAQASTSGTSIDFTSIPSWVKRITVMFAGVSSSGTDDLLIQIGDSGGIETSSYVSVCNRVDGVVSQSTTGFIVTASNFGAANTAGGAITINLLSSNTWVAFGNIYCSPTTVGVSDSAGQKALSATLDRVRITTTGGTNTFDAGSVNIMYE